MPTNTWIATSAKAPADVGLLSLPIWKNGFATLAFSVIALIYVVLGLIAIATLGWTELYADQWRLYPLYLELPFPQNILVLENGHRPIFPALIRVLEIWVFQGRQGLQLVIGAMLALTTFLVVAATIRMDRTATTQVRWIAIAATAFAIFWLGNVRMLLHGNESVHAYLLTACLAGAIALALGRKRTNREVWLSCILAFVATFSFGPGLAVFPTLAVLFALQRRWRALAIVIVALAMTMVMYFMLPGGTSVRDTLRFDPLTNVQVAGAWLASAWVTLLNPLLVPGADQSLPAFVRPMTRLVSEQYANAFGSPYQHPLAYAWVSIAAIAYATWITLNTWRQRQCGAIRFTGLGLAWFAIGVAGIVALGRSVYFEIHPDQIFANRYLPWSCLFWLGVFLVWLGTSMPDPQRRRRPLALLAGVVLAAGLLTSRGHWIWGDILQQGIRLNAAGAASGVVDAKQSLGETVYEQLASGLPAVRTAQVSMFAWPETRFLGQRVTATENTSAPLATVRRLSIHNRLYDDSALLLEVRVDDAMKSGMPSRLLVVADGIAAGVLVLQHDESGLHYAGYVRAPEQASIMIGPLDDYGHFECWTDCI